MDETTDDLIEIAAAIERIDACDYTEDAVRRVMNTTTEKACADDRDDA